MAYVQKYKYSSLLKVNQVKINEAEVCLFLYTVQKGTIFYGSDPNDFGCKTISNGGSGVN